MTLLVRNLEQFDPNYEHWQQECRSFGSLLEVNGITVEGKKLGPAA